MNTKSASLIIMLALFVMPSVADDVVKWIGDLNDSSPPVREAAASALGHLKESRAVGPLILALEDEDYIVRENAAESLGKINDTRAVDPLIQALNDRVCYVGASAASALVPFPVEFSRNSTRRKTIA